MRIYVAGPMRGYDDFNFPAFDEAAYRLRALGHEVFSPAEHDREQYGDSINPDTADALGFDLRCALGADLAWVTHAAEAVAVLPGWEDSKGARAEVATAHALGLIVAPVEAFEWCDDNHDGAPPAVGATTSRAVPPGVTEGRQGDPTPFKFEPMPARAAGATSETRVTSETGGEKGSKLARFDLIPAGPLWQLAELFGKGAEKYADRNWERGYPWSLSYAALNRHLNLFWQGVDTDAETGMPHMVAVAWHAFALLEFATAHPGFDDRPTSQAIPYSLTDDDAADYAATFDDAGSLVGASE